jgi:hypothetical protein
MKKGIHIIRKIFPNNNGFDCFDLEYGHIFIPLSEKLGRCSCGLYKEKRNSFISLSEELGKYSCGLYNGKRINIKDDYTYYIIKSSRFRIYEIYDKRYHNELIIEDILE